MRSELELFDILGSGMNEAGHFPYREHPRLFAAEVGTSSHSGGICNGLPFTIMSRHRIHAAASLIAARHGERGAPTRSALCSSVANAFASAASFRYSSAVQSFAIINTAARGER